jgi:predicted Zn-dependent protease
MDQQKLTGQGIGSAVFRIKRGKIITPVSGFAYLFRSADLWKNLVAIGAAVSARTKGFESTKGQPEQAYRYSISAVPAKISNVSVIDLRRKISA